MHVCINIQEPICVFLFNRYTDKYYFSFNRVNIYRCCRLFLFFFCFERIFFWKTALLFTLLGLVWNFCFFSLACHPFAEVSSYLFSPEIWLRIIFPIIHTYSKTLFVHLISDKLVHSNIVSCQYDNRRSWDTRYR